VPLIVLAGTEYGSASSRDWAAKGTMLLGVRAVLAESFERIHRSNLIGMGALPVQFTTGDSADPLGLTGTDTYTVTGLDGIGATDPMPTTVAVRATAADGTVVELIADVRIDTPNEADYYRHAGILQYVLRQLAKDHDRRRRADVDRKPAASFARPTYQWCVPRRARRRAPRGHPQRAQSITVIWRCAWTASWPMLSRFQQSR